MKIIKRSGAEVDFDLSKITAAITKANQEVPAIDQLSEEQIAEISDHVKRICYDLGRALNVEEIQDTI